MTSTIALEGYHATPSKRGALCDVDDMPGSTQRHALVETPATPASAGGALRRLNLSGSAARVLAPANGARFDGEGAAKPRAASTLTSRPSLLSGTNRSIGDHVLHQRLAATPCPPRTPTASERRGSTRETLTPQAQVGSALKGGAQRVVQASPAAAAAAPPSATSRAFAPGPSPRSVAAAAAATLGPPPPARTPSRVSLALEELDFLGYTPSRLRALGDDSPPATQPGPSTPASVATPFADAAPATDAAADAAAPLDRPRGVSGTPSRVVVPFARPPPGSAADTQAVAALSAALAAAADAAAEPRPRDEPAAAAARPMQYAIAKVSRSGRKAELGADFALTPVRRSARVASLHPEGERRSVRELLEAAHYAYMPNAALCPGAGSDAGDAGTGGRREAGAVEPRGEGSVAAAHAPAQSGC